jgi:quercetin dioxygenase-like cupin family protein
VEENFGSLGQVFSAQIYPKGWGHELWLVNSKLYCGKILVFKDGKRCSWHFHKIKTETFYVLQGEFRIMYSMEDDIQSANSIVLNQGQIFHVPRLMRHQMIANGDSQLIEVSTEHSENDSYRLIKGD